MTDIADQVPTRNWLDIGVTGIATLLLLLLLWYRPSMPTPIPDFDVYRTYYNSTLNFGFGWGSLLFVWLVRGCRWLGLSAESFLFALSALALLIKLAVFLLARKRLQVPCWSFLFLSLPGFFLVDYFEIRNAVSQALMLAALWAVTTKHWAWSFPFVIAALGFHLAAAPFVPLLYLPWWYLTALVIGLAVIGGIQPDFEQLVTSFRGSGGVGNNAQHPGLAKFLALALGGYIAPLAGLFRQVLMQRLQLRDFQHVLAVVLASFIFYVGLWMIPSVPDVLFHRAHRVGWFGLGLLLVVVSQDRVARWIVCVPLTALMFGYYAYLNLDLSGLLR